jgi:hypothetical protein
MHRGGWSCRKIALAQAASQRGRRSERGKRCVSYATLGYGWPQRVRRQNAYATLCANLGKTKEESNRKEANVYLNSEVV